ncbi:MAG: GTP-binding protein [Sandaracinaceae bacterium]|nr:GTP-binding protein [Sandaracinaceae bacterium]
MIGATGVGKTSLVSRYVYSEFSGEYLTTIGVKIDRHRVRRGERLVDLMLWDLSGEDEFQSVQPAYLRGAAGYFLVIDGTRVETVDTGLLLEDRVRRAVGDVPFVVLLNKVDLVASWAMGPSDVAELQQRGWRIVETSAKTGVGVDAAFDLLVDAILSRAEGERWTLTR